MFIVKYKEDTFGKTYGNVRMRKHVVRGSYNLIYSRVRKWGAMPPTFNMVHRPGNSVKEYWDVKMQPLTVSILIRSAGDVFIAFYHIPEPKKRRVNN